MAPTARVTFRHPTTDVEHIELIDEKGTMHLVETGGDQSSTYCYEHQTFDCWDNLTPDELHALINA